MLLDDKTLHFDVAPFHHFLVRVLLCSDFPPQGFLFQALPLLRGSFFGVLERKKCSVAREKCLERLYLDLCVFECACACVCARARANVCMHAWHACVCACVCLCVSGARSLYQLQRPNAHQRREIRVLFFVGLVGVRGR